MKMFNWHQIFRYVLFLIVITGCKKEDEIQIDPEMPCTYVDGVIEQRDILTWGHIYKDSITTIVGDTILVISKLKWETDFGWFDIKPTINPASEVMCVFEDSDKYVEIDKWDDIGRGNLLLYSDHIEKYISYSAKQEKYALNCKELSNNNKYYLLQGTIEYRNNPSEDKLNNPMFISQSNNIKYWSQKF